MFTISNKELENNDRHGDFILCDRCGERHIIEYGDEILPDGKRVKFKLLSFYKCGNKQFLAGINGKRV